MCIKCKVFAENNAKVWDSGKVESGLSTGIACGGTISERSVYRWQVTVWDQEGKTHTAESSFETGVSNVQEWKDAEFMLGFYDSDEMKEAAGNLLLENIRNENPDASSVRKNYGNNTLAVGFLGSNVITPVLTDTGYGEVSYDLLLQDEQPSWLFEVKAGATTIWERWNSYTPGVGFGDSEMNSFNLV